MKRLFAVLLIVFMLIGSALAEGTGSSFVFRDGVRWGMTTDEVKSCESTAPFSEGGSADALNHLHYGPVTIGKWEDAYLEYLLTQNYLSCIIYTNIPGAQHTYLHGALSSKYGDSISVKAEEISSLLKSFNKTADYGSITQGSQWQLPDGTCIFQFMYLDSTFIVYVAPSFSPDPDGAFDTTGL